MTLSGLAFGMTSYQFSAPPSVTWAFMPEGRATPLFDSPELWFSAEFLHRPLDGWEIDWTPSPLRCPDMLPKALGQGKILTECTSKGVIIKLPKLQRIWVLTGEYDWERNGYLGRWPD